MGTVYIRDPWSSIFGSLRSMLNEGFGSEFHNRGLKSIISKPHNLITKTDKDGNIESFDLEVVYTPFKKSDVKVSVKDNVLSVSCGLENKKKNEEMVYCGISHQSYSFSIPLSEAVDIPEIKAKAEDGLLYITIPIKKPIKVEPVEYEIKIS